MKSKDKIIEELRLKHEEEIKAETRKLEIKEDILKEYGVIPSYVSDDDKRPTVSIDFQKPEDYIKFIKKVYPKSLTLYYLHDGCAGFDCEDAYKRYEKSTIKDTDGKEWKYLDYYAQKGKYFQLSINATFDIKNDSMPDQEFRVMVVTDKYDFWIDGYTRWINPLIIGYADEVDHHETENARKYNYRAKDIIRRYYHIKDIERINFYGGSKRHYCKDESNREKFESLLFNLGY